MNTGEAAARPQDDDTKGTAVEKAWFVYDMVRAGAVASRNTDRYPSALIAVAEARQKVERAAVAERAKGGPQDVEAARKAVLEHFSNFQNPKAPQRALEVHLDLIDALITAVNQVPGLQATPALADALQAAENLIDGGPQDEGGTA